MRECNNRHAVAHIPSWQFHSLLYISYTAFLSPSPEKTQKEKEKWSFLVNTPN
jgi:hypothetical protein